MVSSKLYIVLKTFEKYEQNRLRKFIISPFFNKSQSIIDLYDLIILYFTKKLKKNETFNKTFVWQKLFPNQDVNDVRFRKLQSDLLKLIEKYLAYTVYEQNPLNESTYLIQAVTNRNLSSLSNSAMASVRRYSERNAYQNADFYLKQYQIERYFYDLTDYEGQRTIQSNVESIANNLDYFYLSEKLKYYCSSLAQKNFFSKEYEILFIDEIIEHIEKYDYINIPPIAVYYYIYKTIKFPEIEENYSKLKNLLTKHGLLFPKKEAELLYTAAINRCVRLLNSTSNIIYLQEVFELYKDLLIKEIIILNDILSPFDYKNIVVAGLRLKEFDWVDNFIDKYAVHLAEDIRENAVSFNRAQYYFYKKDYDEVIFLLNQVEYNDITYNLNSKTMLLASYFKKGDYDPLYSLFESFRVFLNRERNISQSKKTNYLNLIKFTKKLTKLFKGDTIKLSKLKKQIEETSGIVNKKWLLEQVDLMF